MSELFKANPDRMLTVGEKMIPFKSWKGEESALADWLTEMASSWGGEAEVMEVRPGRRQLNIRFKGKQPGRVLAMNGHLDIDPLAGGYKRDPWKLVVEGNRVYGAGIYNMRAGLLAMIEASQILREHGGLDKGELVLSFVVGELQGGVGADYLLSQGFRADAVIVTEPYGARNVCTVHSGVAVFGITVHGISMWTGKQKYGVNAIEKMGEVIRRLPSITFTCTPRADLPELPLMNMGGIIGGRGENYDLKAVNFQSDKCTLFVDIRFLPDQSIDTVEADLRMFLDQMAAEDKDFRFSIEKNPGAGGDTIPMRPCDVPLSEEIVQTAIDAIRAETGADPEIVGIHMPHAYAGDDLGHFWHYGIPGILMGPEGVDGEPEEPDTYTYLDEMVLSAEVLARTAHEFLGKAHQ